MPAPPSAPTATSWPEPDSEPMVRLPPLPFSTPARVFPLCRVLSSSTFRLTLPAPSVLTAASPAPFGPAPPVVSMLVSSRVTLAVAPASALMVTLLVVEAEESRFRMTGAESALVTPPWLTFWPLSVAETVMLSSSKYQVSAIATVGRKTAISTRETSRVKSFRMFIALPPYSGKVSWCTNQS